MSRMNWDRPVIRAHDHDRREDAKRELLARPEGRRTDPAATLPQIKLMRELAQEKGLERPAGATRREASDWIEMALKAKRL